MAEPTQEQLRKRCQFMYDFSVANYGSDVRSFKVGDKVCVYMPKSDGSMQIELWDYLDSMLIKLGYDAKTKRGSSDAFNESERNKPMLDMVKKLQRRSGPGLSAQEIAALKSNVKPVTFYLLRHPKYKNEEVIDLTFVGTYNPAAGGKKKTHTRKTRGRRHKTRRA